MYDEELAEIEFEDLPGDIQENFESLCENEGIDIDELWVEVRLGEYTLPRYMLRKILTWCG